MKTEAREERVEGRENIQAAAGRVDRSWSDRAFSQRGEEGAEPRIPCHLVDVQSVDSEEGGRGGGGAGKERSSQSSSPLLN